MKTKILAILIPLVVLICVIVGVLLIIKPSKFYVEDKYYNTNGLVDVSKDELESLLSEKKSFVLFAYSNVCMFSTPCETVFASSSIAMGINILQIPLSEYKTTSLYNKVKYAPTVIIIKNGRVVDYLDSNSDEDEALYQDNTAFENWIYTYIEAK